MVALQESLLDLKVDGRKEKGSKHKSKKDSRGRKKSRSSSGSDQKNKKSKKKKKKSGSRRSSKNSSRSRSGSDSSSSSSSSGRWMLFRPGKEDKVRYGGRTMERFRGLCFKRRPDLLNFAAKRPGALAAHFLAQVRERLSKGEPRSGKELLETDAASWIPVSGLKEVRDLREATVLCRILTELTHRRPEKAADIIAMRLREIRFAKTASSSWEKAEAVSLMPGTTPGTAPVPDLAMGLQ